MSLNITIDFSNHQSPKTNIDNADTTTVTSTFLQSNSSPLPGRFWKMMFLFNARDMIFRPLLEGDFPPTYPDLPPATRGIMLTYFMLLFNKLFAVSGLNKVTKIFILAEMFAVQKQKAGALTCETSTFNQYPKIYVYLIPFDYVSDHYNSTWSISPRHSEGVQATETHTHTHNQRVYVQQVDPAEMWVHGRFRVSEVTSCICSKDYMKDQVASKLLTGDQAGSSPLVDPRS